MTINDNNQNKNTITNAVYEETKSIGNMFKHTIISSGKNSMINIINEGINLLAYAAKSLVSMLIIGEPPRNNGNYWNSDGNVSYRNFYDNSRSYNYRGYYNNDRLGYKYSTLPVSDMSYGTFRSSLTANEAISRMDDVMAQYGILRVSEMIEICKQCDDTFIYNNTYVNNSFGWDDITTATVEAADNGRWRIVMPKEKSLNR